MGIDFVMDGGMASSRQACWEEIEDLETLSHPWPSL